MYIFENSVYKRVRIENRNLTAGILQAAVFELKLNGVKADLMGLDMGRVCLERPTQHFKALPVVLIILPCGLREVSLEIKSIWYSFLL